jgi:threonine/homoserine/homoserine lactone efflux protein
VDPLFLFLLAFGLGFAAAIPVGGSQIEMAKRAVHGHLRSASMVVLGSVSSDVLYGVVALFGIAPFMETPGILATFNALGAVLLWGLAILTLRESRRPHELDPGRAALTSRTRAYVTGFSLAFSNPQMVVSWLLGVTLAKHLGIASPFPASGKAVFIAGGALGLASYLALLGGVMYRVKHYVPLAALGRVYFWLGIVLLGLSGFFVYGALRYFVGGG